MAPSIQFYQSGDYDNTILRKLLQNQTYAIVTGPSDGQYFRLDGANSPFTRTSATVVTVPDEFSLTGLGSITLISGGTAENITFAPVADGNVVINTSGTSSTGQFLVNKTGASLVSIFKTDGGQSNMRLTAYSTGQSHALFSGYAYSGTEAVPVALPSGDTLLEIESRGYNSSAIVRGARFEILTPAVWTTSSNPTRMRFSTTSIGATANSLALTLESWGGVILNAAARSTPAWGTAGVQLTAPAATYTDNSTLASGTATTAAFSSFGRPTLAATNATVTTTDAATLYIANSPANGTNNTITNPWALWVDDGNVRIDGTLYLAGAAVPVFRTQAAITSGAGASAGTLTNAPAVGNPTKWIPINDNGTTRYIPAW